MANCTFKHGLTELPKLLFTKVGNGLQYIWKEHRIAVLGTASVLVALKAHHVYTRNQRRLRWNALGRDVIVLHGFERATTCPSMSPFIMKLETYIRMAGLKYEYDSEEPIGRKTKTPWITINGEEIADSQLIMEYLAKKFKLNFSAGLTDEQKGAARAMAVMTDEHLLWGLFEWRVRDPDMRLFDMMKVPFYFRILFRFAKGTFLNRIKSQGIGHHSVKDIEAIMEKDIKALSLYLGDKPFLMGNEPCEADCSLFGTLAQFVWGTPGSTYAVLLQTDYRNLMHYCFRMKEKFYPDWEKCLRQS